jgi:hypothetical protein
MLAFHPDFGQLVSYQFEPMPEDADGQVRFAIHRAIKLVLQENSSPIIQRDAARALDLGGGDPIAGVWGLIKPRMRFRQDTDIANDLQAHDPYGKRDLVETFISPVNQAKLIELRGSGVEDCDGFTMYGASLLTALGVPVTMCAVSAEQPGVYSHVYLVAYWNAMRIPLDLSHGPYPGWECPNMGRLREWPVTADTIRPSVFWPLLIAGATAGYLAWRAGH